MKRLLLILLIIPLAFGCAKVDSPYDMDDQWTTGQGGKDDPIVFAHERDYNAFNSITELEKRFHACAVPDNILRQKTTRALGLSILHYPMNSLIFAYNYYDMPVKIVYDHSPLHRELAARADAADALVGIFENTRIDKDVYHVATNYQDISLADELFLEYFLGSGLVKGLDKGNNKKKLADAVAMKRDRRLADPDLNGTLALIPLAYMSERLGLGVRFSDEIVSSMHYFTLEEDLFK